MIAHADVKVIGVYPVPEQAACFLVEMMIDGSDEVPDFSRFTHPLPGQPSSDWQVAYDEQLLDDAGEQVVTDVLLRRPAGWPEHARVMFFFHFLDVHRPLDTPFGEATLPPPSDVAAAKRRSASAVVPEIRSAAAAYPVVRAVSRRPCAAIRMTIRRRQRAHPGTGTVSGTAKTRSDHRRVIAIRSGAGWPERSAAVPDCAGAADDLVNVMRRWPSATDDLGQASSDVTSPSGRPVHAPQRSAVALGH